MRVLVVAAALAAVAVAVPGAGAQQQPKLRLVGYGPAVISPNGNGIHDVLHVQVKAPAGSVLGLRAYFWGGRLHGWHRIRTGVTVTAAPGGTTTLTWDGTNTLAGRRVGDGTYLVTVCYKDPGHRLPPVIPPAQQRPGAAEATVSNPPWHFSGCLKEPRAVRVERLAAYVDSTSSFAPGQRPPLVVSADKGHASVRLEQDCSGRTFPAGRLPRGLRSGLYHYIVTDPAGDEFEAPLVVRNGRLPVDDPPPHTALLVWPYLTWRAYSAYDANLDGIPDTWYQWWRQRRVSFTGALLQRGEEDDHVAAAPFERWACARNLRVQSVTDVELRHIPLSALRRYAAVIYPGHSEYYQPGTYYLLRRYRDQGGHLFILQANPFYRPVRIDRKHNAMILLDFDARTKNRSDFGLAGVGYDGCCFPRSHAAPYVAATGRDYVRVRWLFRGTGIGPGERFGYAGSESDRVDPAWTPRDHVVAAEAIMPGKFGVINAALVWSKAGKGEVLSTGNYDFLRMGRGITWKLLDNVWRKFVG